MHGAFIKTWNAPWLPCTWKQERDDAAVVRPHDLVAPVLVCCQSLQLNPPLPRTQPEALRRRVELDVVSDLGRELAVGRHGLKMHPRQAELLTRAGRQKRVPGGENQQSDESEAPPARSVLAAVLHDRPPLKPTIGRGAHAPLGGAGGRTLGSGLLRTDDCGRIIHSGDAGAGFSRVGSARPPGANPSEGDEE